MRYAGVFCNLNAIFRRFEYQSKRQYTVRNTVSDIMEELMFFGGFYNMEIELNDFYVIDQLHNVLQDMYNGTYDVDAIMDRVRGN